MKSFNKRDAEDLEVHEAESDAPAKKKRINRQWGGALLGLLAGMAGLVAGRLGHLWPHFDVFAQFGAQFVFVVFAFAAAFFVPRWKFVVGTCLTVLAVAAYGAWPHYVSDGQKKLLVAPATGEKVLRVAHFNTFKNNSDAEAVANELLRIDADVVTLVEVTPDKKSVFDSLANRYPFRVNCYDVPNCYMGIVSKFPIEAVGNQVFWEGPPYIKAVLGGQMAGLTVYGIHTIRFPHSRAQLKQVMAMSRKLADENGHLVVMGDFNATPFSRVVSVLEQSAGLTRMTQLPTWPATLNFPQLAIDHIFVSSGIRALDSQQIGRAVGSDHYPIVLTLGVPGK